MKSNRLSCFQFLPCFAVCLLLAAVVADAQEYKIKFVRPQKVGDQYELNISTTRKQVVDVNVAGKPAQKKEENVEAELTGTVKVLEVGGDKSLATKLTCKVDHMTNDKTEVYPAGTVITAERSGKKTNYTVDGKPVESSKALALRMLLSVGDVDGMLDDDKVNGTTQPQKVDGTWPIDQDAAAKAMSAGGLPVTANEIKGEGKLVKVKRMNGTQVMEVVVNGTATMAKDKPMQMGTSISSGLITMDNTYTLPVDESQGVITQASKLHVEMTIKLPSAMGTSVVTVDQETKESHNPM